MAVPPILPSASARTRASTPGIKVEILVPDFRGKGRMERALDVLQTEPPDVFNHNLETVEPLYRNVRPGADYQWSLKLLQEFKRRNPGVPTKSGIMLGLGETRTQVEQALRDLRDHDVDMITLGQYYSQRHIITRLSNTGHRRRLMSSPKSVMRWASAIWPPGRWCAPATTQT